MARDCDGNELKIGDKVAVEAFVIGATPEVGGMCVVTLETASPCRHTGQVSRFQVSDCQAAKAPPDVVPCPVAPTAAGVALAVLAVLFGGGTATAQVPPQAPPIVDRVAALERKVADLEAKLAKAGQVSAAACPCGDSCPCAARTTTAAPAAITYPAYAPAYGYGASPAYGSFGSGGGSCAGGSCAGGSCSMPSSGGGFFRRR